MCVLTYIAVTFDTAWLFIKSLDLLFHFFSIRGGSRDIFWGVSQKVFCLYGLYWDEIGLFTTCHNPRSLPPFFAS